jgi:hypothetical protein
VTVTLTYFIRGYLFEMLRALLDREFLIYSHSGLTISYAHSCIIFHTGPIHSEVVHISSLYRGRGTLVTPGNDTTANLPLSDPSDGKTEG